MGVGFYLKTTRKWCKKTNKYAW